MKRFLSALCAAFAALSLFAAALAGDVSGAVEASVAIHQPDGDGQTADQLSRSDNRGDYPALTDAEFANFRMIEAGDIAAGRLYRSSSPVNPEINRNAYADAAAAGAGVRTFVNLADSEEEMRGYKGFSRSYYSAQNIIALDLDVHFDSSDFKDGLTEGLRFMADNEGPYLVHCTLGRDRAGFVSAILECLMGADEAEIIADYMVTYHNYNGVEPGTAQYERIADSKIRKSLCDALGLERLQGADLRTRAEEYLKDIGMLQDEIDALRANLGR